MYALPLNMSGYTVETAEDGLRPDLIVMDLQMPLLMKPCLPEQLAREVGTHPSAALWSHPRTAKDQPSPRAISGSD